MLPTSAGCLNKRTNSIFLLCGNISKLNETQFGNQSVVEILELEGLNVSFGSLSKQPFSKLSAFYQDLNITLLRLRGLSPKFAPTFSATMCNYSAEFEFEHKLNLISASLIYLSMICLIGSLLIMVRFHGLSIGTFLNVLRTCQVPTDWRN